MVLSHHVDLVEFVNNPSALINVWCVSDVIQSPSIILLMLRSMRETLVSLCVRSVRVLITRVSDLMRLLFRCGLDTEFSLRLSHVYVVALSVVCSR